MPYLYFGVFSFVVPVLLAIYQYYTNGLIELANSIPVPDFLNNISVSFLPSTVVYMLQIFQVPYGFSIIVSALLIRLAVRRFLG